MMTCEITVCIKEKLLLYYYNLDPISYEGFTFYYY